MLIERSNADRNEIIALAKKMCQLLVGLKTHTRCEEYLVEGGEVVKVVQAMVIHGEIMAHKLNLFGKSTLMGHSGRKTLRLYRKFSEVKREKSLQP